MDIFASNALPLAARPLEVVERKGLGHPDTICDSLVEAASRALTRVYLERAGTVLHHNLDKALLVAGSSSPAFGGGRVLEPMRFVLGDRATNEIDGERIPVDEITSDAVHRWVRENLRGVDPARHLSCECVLRPTSAQLRGLFAKGRTAANDSSVGIGWAPLTETEKLVLETEQWLNAPSTKAKFPESGEDVKVLGVRRKRKLELTIAVAFVDRFVANEKRYFERKEALRAELLTHLAPRLRTLDSIDARLNVLDTPGKGVDGGYLTVLGTSADGADSGAVGRGNRVNGLTSFLRPSSHEAAAGKNPRSHTGKIYNLLAYQTARLIHESSDCIEEAYVVLASRIGSPIDEPWIASAELVLSEGVAIDDVEDSVREIFGRQLAGADAFVERLIVSARPCVEREARAGGPLARARTPSRPLRDRISAFFGLRDVPITTGPQPRMVIDSKGPLLFLPAPREGPHMNRKLHTFTCLGFVLGVSSLSVAQTQSGPPTEPQPFVEVTGDMEFTGRMIAVPLQADDAARYGLSMDAIAAHARAASQALARFPLVRYDPRSDMTIFLVPEGTESAVAHELMAGGDFQYVEPDWRVFPVGCPNDTQFGGQWHHVASKMNSCAGWDIETGDPSIVVAVCDTGVRTDHTDLLLHRKEGYNAVNHQWESAGGQISDINGHGTMTTGCAAANGNNGKGVTGTGWDLSHRMMRVSNTSDGSSSIATLIDAVETAADVGDRVASVSYSGVTSSGVQGAGSYIRARNGLLVWAAGNEGGNLSGNRDDQVIIVGSTGHSDVRSSFSNYGTLVDLFAPGEDILSTTRNSTTSYGSASGTSFACPLTAGLLGLIFSADPSLTPAQAEDLLRAGCDDLRSRRRGQHLRLRPHRRGGLALARRPGL